MYHIRELPVIQGGADRAIAAAEAYPPDYDEFFEAGSTSTPASASKPSSSRAVCDSSQAT
jgi:hypothetical protein